MSAAGEDNFSVVETPRAAATGHYGGSHSYAPIPIDASHFDLGALGWDNDGFFASLRGNMNDGFQETDLFC